MRASAKKKLFSSGGNMSEEILIRYTDFIKKKLGLPDKTPKIEETIFKYDTKLR